MTFFNRWILICWIREIGDKNPIFKGSDKPLPTAGQGHLPLNGNKAG